MFAYSMAAANCGLKHALLPHLMTGCMTGWPKADAHALAASAAAAALGAGGDEGPIVGGGGGSGGSGSARGAASCFLAPLTPPPFLHYCQQYPSAATGSGFAKRSVPHGVLDCGAPPVGAVAGTKQQKRSGAAIVDHATGAALGEGGAASHWNTLAHCAAVRGIEHARAQHCARGTR